MGKIMDYLFFEDFPGFQAAVLASSHTKDLDEVLGLPHKREKKRAQAPHNLYEDCNILFT